MDSSTLQIALHRHLFMRIDGEPLVLMMVMNRINQSEIGLLSQNIVCSHAISQRNTCSNINKTFADLGVTFPIEKLVYWHIST